MCQNANSCEGRRGRVVPAPLCGLGVLLMLGVARALRIVIFDPNKVIPIELRGNTVLSLRGLEWPNPDVLVLPKAINNTVTCNDKEVDHLQCKFYGHWSSWRRCNRRCEHRRVRRCQVAERCGTNKMTEHRPCHTQRGRCSPVFTHRAVGGLKWEEIQLLPVIYEPWSAWTPCRRSCKQKRRRRCVVHSLCKMKYIQEIRKCSAPNSRCDRRFTPTPGSSEADSATTALLPDVSTSPEQKNALRKGSKDTPRPPRRNRKQDRKKNKGKSMKRRSEDKDDLMAAQQTCGRRPPAKRGSYRVMGGREARRLSWPWQAALLDPLWEDQYCAGTLIAPQWLLTAAHCIKNWDPALFSFVRVGEHNLKKFEGSEQDIRPEREFPHPEYNNTTNMNDIALIRLQTPSKDCSHRGYACLPEPGFTPDRNSLCYILGWGKHNATALGTRSLHEAQVPVVSHRRCQKVFSGYDNATQVCAGYRWGGVASCAGDSGGPLLCPKTEAGRMRWFLVGITSHGKECRRGVNYSIYTRVTSYLDWITDTILSYSCERRGE